MNSEIIQGFQLSPQQKHLWLLQQYTNSLPFRSLCTVEINSDLHFETLKTTLETIIERHQIFRTNFRFLPGMTIPLQVIEDDKTLSIQHYDFSRMKPDKQQNALTALFESAKLQNFDFEKSSLLQVSLVKFSDSQHFLLLNLPALYADTASLNNLVAEINRIYKANLHGEALVDEPVQYILFSEWQNELLQSKEAEIGKDYWQQYDMSSIRNVKLPRENSIVEKTTFAPQIITQTIQPKLAAKLASLAAQFDTSENIFFLTCWQILIWRLTGIADMVVGNVCDGRPEEELQEALGLFAKHIPIHSRLDHSLKFSELLEQTALVQSRAYDWQECFNWEEVVETDTAIMGVPFLPFCFEFTEQFSSSFTEEVTFSLVQQYVCFDRFKVKLAMTRCDDNLVAEFHYDASLFSSADIQQLMTQYQTLLESVIANPQATINELEILNHEQRHQLLVDFNNTQVNFSQDKNLHQLFVEQVERTPNNIAVIYEQQQLTYAQLNASANQLAHYLQKLGVAPDVLVGICIERSLSMVVALLAVLKAGGAYVPIDPMYPQERISLMLEDTQAPVLLTQQRLLDILPQHQGYTICLDTNWETIAQESELNPVSNVTLDHLAYVIYTSGSTGKPKGAMLPHRAICNHMLWMQTDFPLTATDKVLQKTPFSFDASVWEFYAPLLVGAQLIMAKPGGHQDSDYLIQTIVEHKITTLQLVPTLLRMLLENEQITNCQSLKNVFCGGEPLTGELQERFFAHLNAELHNLYGPTETCIDATYWTCKQRLNQHTVPIGRPIANTQVYILDNQLQPVPVGVIGELHIGGAGLARGYLNRPELTAEKFIPNHLSNEAEARIYKTGDLARFLPDGSIEYCERIDHQVKIRGFRIELGEIEALLTQHPQVRLVAVIAREDEPGNPRLVAYIVTHSEQILPESELHQFLKEQLPEYMIPSAFVMLETLPLTPNGKLDRRALPAPKTSRSFLGKEYLQPRDTVELALTQIWSNILNVYPVGVQDNFFDLGGHSLLAVRLMAHIKQKFSQNLPLATLFQYPTIESLANLLRQESGVSSWSPLVEVQKGNSQYPFFCLPGGGGNVLYLYDLARYLGENQTFYGLQAPGLNGESEPLTCVEDMAAYYIQAIQTVQPEGPYFLGGHSFGGSIAYEMAQQLVKSGYEVALVAILDAPAPVASDKPVYIDVDDATRLTETARLIERWAGKSLDISYEILQPLELDAQLAYLKEQLIAVDLLPAGTDTKQVRGLVQVFEANLQASIKYSPQEVYPSCLTLLRAREVNAEDAALLTELRQDPAWGWGQFSAQNVDIHVVPGDHITMMTQPHISSVAEKLRICIEQANVGS
ncbi:non-ribosomal peptide synthetase [Halotia branconii]|uniref:Amino acid adenylation domain-containing protein n=1 Tax=Halotia branconii CENA392 TaxID=1539056 RepID=A0AAJ6P8A6_9CYAN|nr:non-ribosomal peptide synthetase [Halotia branconii]WGV24584.1 amino acid adenylation domain-containing protein [Halotia branconii CENA392]